MKRLLACAAALVFSVSVWSSGIPFQKVSANQVSLPESDGSVASVEIERGEKTVVTVNSETAKTLTPDEEDYSYETSDESITEISKDCGYVNDEILIFFKSGTPILKKLEIVNSIDAEIVGYLGLLNRYQLRIEPSDIYEIQALCETLMENEEVELASCNIAIKTEKTAAPSDPWTESDGNEYTYGWDESDPAGSNWWLEAIQAPSAWDYSEYFNHIDVGIVDCGVDMAHEDLQGKIVFPSSKLEKQNSIDDHGTHVAGIIAANANNNTGISGICQNCTLHFVDWEPIGLQLWSTEERLFTGLAYTVRDGAKVINYSVGATGSMPTIDAFMPFYEWFLDIEARYFSLSMAKLLKEGYDFIVVQSAGNGSAECAVDARENGMFCSIDEDNAYTGATGLSAEDIINRIIVVGAAQNMGNSSFRQAYFSNGGDRVDICAPGYDVFSCCSTEGGSYCYMSGTSMSAPVVTAVTALAWSVNPSLSGDVIKSIVCDPANTCYEVADNTDEYHPLVDTYRMVNAKLAVEAVLALTQTAE